MLENPQSCHAELVEALIEVGVTTKVVDTNGRELGAQIVGIKH
jgi:hypothetical protein